MAGTLSRLCFAMTETDKTFSSVRYGEGDIKSIEDYLVGYDMVWDSRSDRSLRTLNQDFRFQLFVLPRDARAKILVADEYNTDCLPLTSLSQERDCSVISLHGPNSSQIWAAIEFFVYEGRSKSCAPA